MAIQPTISLGGGNPHEDLLASPPLTGSLLFLSSLLAAQQAKSGVLKAVYGFAFTKDGKVIVMDVGNHDLVTVSYKTDDDMKRPVPLKIV